MTVSGAASSRSSAIFDVDDDGALDIVVNEFNGPPQVLMNNWPQKKNIHFLKVKLTMAPTTNRPTGRSRRHGQGAIRREDLYEIS